MAPVELIRVVILLSETVRNKVTKTKLRLSEFFDICTRQLFLKQNLFERVFSI